ncbi:MAG: ATP-dependent DNA helicase [Candidatus Sumerlaeaceae bacterium]|nr:ATP-dependent DNA helicase [Candidatus Sumerlaeaceae bacterium]
MHAENLIRAAMHRHWGFSNFRPLQREAMLALADGRDAVVVLPTGGGKSLCYQAPAVALGPCLVVSPLISLMQDQVAALNAQGVAAAFINSTLDREEASRIALAWRSGRLNLLYAAPERVLTGSFLAMLRAAPPCFIAIDEAHCISHWGHDFRPEYRRLGGLREQFPTMPIHAYTATATARVREDIANQLALRDPQILVGNFHRPNLHYRVQRRERDIPAQVAAIMSAYEGRSGIVYCITRKRAEQLAESLTKRGFRAIAYHAGMDAADRQRAQQAFTAEEVDAVVATVAFGMGIDRSNVRFVVHAEMPKSIEHYQQETGRAGRDGLPAECVLLYSPADVVKWRQILESDETLDDEVREAQLAKVREMNNFASRLRCRHRSLVEYFGQVWHDTECGNCDVCGGSGPTDGEPHPDALRIAQILISCVLRLKERRGARYTAAIVRGQTERVDPADCGLSTFGLLKDESARNIRRWISELLAQGLLDQSPGQYPVLRCTAAGWEVLRGQRQPHLSRPEKPSAPAASRKRRAEEKAARRARADAGLSAAEQGLFEELRAWRKTTAARLRVAPYVIFHDTALRALAIVRPSTPQALKVVHGIGDRKVRNFGSELLTIIAQYCQQAGLAQDAE